LVTKYYLKENKPQDGYVPFVDIYDISTKDQAYDLLSKLQVNFSKGLQTGDECTVNSLEEKCVYSNRMVQNAHHDFICHSIPENCANQCKFTLEHPKAGDILPQLDCKYLLWWYPSFSEDKRKCPKNFRIPQVKEKLNRKELGFLRGSGCATGLSIDIITFLKRTVIKKKNEDSDKESENDEESEKDTENKNDEESEKDAKNKKINKKRKKINSAPLPKKKKKMWQ